MVVNVTNGNITYNGKITGHGTYAQVPADFVEDIDDVITVNNDVRMFKGDRLVIANVGQGNKVIYDGKITGHGTFAKLPADFTSDFDAVHTVGNDIRLVKGDRLVVVSINQGAITYDGPLLKHGTYPNVPVEWVS
ncbi:hypothetical protein [Streptomyces bambusae]|uniref:Uncharacterized protein n=1 Tax=Streptomyces bambusae TaxID=1550616 RepID=A0ABS6YZ89_9ACTN|nr:hypothetical protein [Streptomyces bambusae]MBW5480788.1 hypothetical protein [Streptomyces bambusae]